MEYLSSLCLLINLSWLLSTFSSLGTGNLMRQHMKKLASVFDSERCVQNSRDSVRVIVWPLTYDCPCLKDVDLKHLLSLKWKWPCSVGIRCCFRATDLTSALRKFLDTAIGGSHKDYGLHCAKQHKLLYWRLYLRGGWSFSIPDGALPPLWWRTRTWDILPSHLSIPASGFGIDRKGWSRKAGVKRSCALLSERSRS